MLAHPEIFKGQQVLELGSGTGLVGLVAALAGAQQVGGEAGLASAGGQRADEFSRMLGQQLWLESAVPPPAAHMSSSCWLDAYQNSLAWSGRILQRSCTGVLLDSICLPRE